MMNRILQPRMLLDYQTRVSFLRIIAILVAVLALFDIPIFWFAKDTDLHWVTWICVYFFVLSCFVLILLRFGFLKFAGTLHALSIMGVTLFATEPSELLARPLGAQFVIPIVTVGFIVGFDAAVVLSALAIVYMIILPLFFGIEWSPWMVTNAAVIVVVIILLHRISRLVDDLQMSIHQEQQARYLVRYFQHELRGYTTGLKGMIPILQSVFDALAAREQPVTNPLTALHILGDAVDGMHGLLQELLIVGRDGILAPIQHEAILVKTLFAHVQSTMTPGVYRPNVVVTLDVPDNLVISGNILHLTLALRTGLRNSVEALDQQPTRHNAQIILRAFLREDRVIIRIEDTGPGFPPAVLSKLQTAPRGPDGRLLPGGWSTKTEGHGLGLALIDSITALHSGHMRFGNLTTRSGAWIELDLPQKNIQMMSADARKPVTT